MRTLLIILLIVFVFIFVGCATSIMETEKTMVDGTKIKYKVKVDIFGQDLTGSDLSASLNPDGRTTIKAGAVNTQTSQVSADVAASMVELVKAMLPYLAPVPTTP